MKKLRALFIALFVGGWIIYILLNWLFSLVGRPVDFFNIIIVGLIISLLFSLTAYGLVHSILKPKLDFLNSETDIVPPFGNKMSRELEIERADFSFEVIKYKIAEYYQITVYDDIEKYILKFYTGMKLSSWGVGGSITYNRISNRVYVTCFPLSGYTEKAGKVTESILNKVEKIIHTK